MLLRLLLLAGLISPAFVQGTEIAYYPYSNRALLEMPGGSPLRPARLIEGVWVVILTESADVDAFIVRLNYETADGRRGASIVAVPRPPGSGVVCHLFEVGAVKVLRVAATPTRICGDEVIAGEP